MRWNIESVHRHGDTRDRVKFAWFPKRCTIINPKEECLKTVWVWLEKYLVHELYVEWRDVFQNKHYRWTHVMNIAGTLDEKGNEEKEQR